MGQETLAGAIAPGREAGIATIEASIPIHGADNHSQRHSFLYVCMYVCTTAAHIAEDGGEEDFPTAQLNSQPAP